METFFAFVAGLFVGVSVALFMAYRKHRKRDPERIRKHQEKWLKDF